MGWLEYDSRQLDIDKHIFYHNNADWKEFHGGVKEELLPNIPEP
jgi:hypothetical protein